MLIPVLIWGLLGCSRQPEKITCTDTAMGTVLQQTLYVSPGTDGGKIFSEMKYLLEDLEKRELSWRETDSLVGIINTSAGKESVELTAPLESELDLVLEVGKRSKGALDITLGKVCRLWNLDHWAQIGGEDFCVPKQEEIEKFLVHTGAEEIRLKEGKIEIPENMELDLGAVGKGIACDRLQEYLQEQENVTGAVISVGGSVLTYGEKPDGENWKVGIAHPREEGNNIAVLHLEGGMCVSTSGDYERYVQKEGVRYHHILDPVTGYPADAGLVSVTIVSESGCLSDALSTACFVLGKEEGLALAESYGVQALLVDSALGIFMTEGMDKIAVLE